MQAAPQWSILNNPEILQGFALNLAYFSSLYPFNPTEKIGGQHALDWEGIVKPGVMRVHVIFATPQYLSSCWHFTCQLNVEWHAQ